MAANALLGAAPKPGVSMYAVVIVIVVAIAMFALLTLVMRFYKRCPSDRILVVYGKGTDESGVRCIHGGAVFVMPLLQD